MNVPAPRTLQLLDVEGLVKFEGVPRNELERRLRDAKAEIEYLRAQVTFLRARVDQLWSSTGLGEW